MKTKEKLILSSIIIVLGTVFNLFFSAALHGMLSRQYSTITLIPLWDCIAGLFSQRQHLLLFVSFEGFICLCCVLFFVQNSRPYQSELVKVAGDIFTPAPVGQFQHGSSRWLKDSEKDTVFKTMEIDPMHPLIKKLLDSGYDNLPFLEKDRQTEPAETGQEIIPPCTTTVEQETADPLPVSIKKQNAKEAKKHDENFEDVDFIVKAADVNEQPTAESAPKPVQHAEVKTEKKTDPNKLFPSGGIVVGMEKDGDTEKLYYIADDTHTLTIGATRSGKTRCLVIQSICGIGLSGESLVISDPKAELYHYTADYLRKLGYEIICLDFKNPEKSTRYNLLQPVIDAVKAKDMERAEMYAWDITNILVGDNSSNEKIWENGEKSTIAAAILCVVVDNAKRPEYQNLTNVYWFIAEMSKAVGGKTPMQAYMQKLPSDHPARALMSIANVAPSRTKGSFDTSALTTLRLFTSRSVYSIPTRAIIALQKSDRKSRLFSSSCPMKKPPIIPLPV